MYFKIMLGLRHKQKLPCEQLEDHLQLQTRLQKEDKENGFLETTSVMLSSEIIHSSFRNPLPLPQREKQRKVNH